VNDGPFSAVLLDQPFACPAQLQPGAIDQQMHRPSSAPLLKRGFGKSNVSARRLSVEWLGAARVRPDD
jgi:hypothetical protein